MKSRLSRLSKTSRISILVSCLVAGSLGVIVPLVAGSPSGAVLQPSSLTQALVSAAQDLRGTQGVQFSSQANPGFGELQGSDSSGSFTLYYNGGVADAAGQVTPVTATIIAANALANSAVNGTPIHAEEFVLDPGTLQVTSSKVVSLHTVGAAMTPESTAD